MRRILRLAMGFDFVCPWCLIGLRQLQQAIAMLRAEAPDVDVECEWLGVQLLPQVPAGGLPFHEFYLRRLGGEAALSQRQAMVRSAAAAAGVRINYPAMHTMPNTADAHRLMQLASGLGDAARRDALLENLFTGYFERGDDLGREATLMGHAAACGYEPDQLAPAFLGAALPYPGGGAVQGVPYFTVNGQAIGSGARPAPELLAAMRAALCMPAAAP